MEYSEDIVYSILKDWNKAGYTDNFLIKDHMFYSLLLDEYFPALSATIDHQVYFTSSESHGGMWSVAAVSLASTKGVLVYADDFFEDGELTSDIRNALTMNLEVSDSAVA